MTSDPDIEPSTLTGNNCTSWIISLYHSDRGCQVDCALGRPCARVITGGSNVEGLANARLNFPIPGWLGKLNYLLCLVLVTSILRNGRALLTSLYSKGKRDWRVVGGALTDRDDYLLLGCRGTAGIHATRADDDLIVDSHVTHCPVGVSG